jgi:hypothetical protein
MSVALRTIVATDSSHAPFVRHAHFTQDSTEHVKKGLGSALLKDALLRAAHATDTTGARALLVHAKDDDARAFDEHFTFEVSPSDP